MSSQTAQMNPTLYSGQILQIQPQPYIAPGLSPADNNTRFLGVFTASHLSICLLVSGFGLIVTGLLGVVSRASLNASAFQAVGISLICFGSFLILIAIAIFVFAIRWGRKKVHVMHSNQPNTPITLLPVSYSVPIMANTGNNSAFNPNASFDNLPFSTMPFGNAGLASGQAHFVLVRPTAPPQSPDAVH